MAAIADWSRRFILFHGKRHPRELGLPEVGQFLESIAQTEKDPVRAIAASRDAVDFLFPEGPTSTSANCRNYPDGGPVMPNPWFRLSLHRG